MTKVTGELISVDDSAYDGFQGMTIYGKTVQNLWVNPSGTANGVTVTSNADGSIDISGEAASDTFVASQKLYVLKQGVSYFLSVDKIIGTSNDYSTAYVNIGFFSQSASIGNTGGVSFGSVYSRVFKFPENAVNCNAQVAVKPAAGRINVHGLRVMLREATPEEIAKAARTPQTLPVYPDGSAPDASDEELGIMPLDEASTLADSDFDDYWCPPGLSSVDEVEVWTAGRNLVSLDKEVTNTGIIFTPTADGGVHVHGTKTGKQSAVCFLDIVGVDQGENWVRVAKVIPDGVYTMSGATSEVYLYANTYVSYNNDDNVGVKDYTIKNDGESVLIDINNPVWSVNVRLVTNPDAETLDCIVYPQLELGSTATAYEPPNITTVPIDLQSNALRSLPDGTRDELHIDREGNCTLVKRVGAVATESEDWAIATTTIEYTGEFDGDVMKNNGKPVPAMSDGYAIKEAYPIGYKQECVRNLDASGSSFVLGAPNGNYTVIDHNVLYKLNVPQTIQLGKISLPKLRKKPLVNNIWANGTAKGTGFSLAPEIDYEYNRWRMGCDGLKADGQHSFWDLGGCIALRDTGTPEKKPVTATVPYMSGFYDLSDLYGAVAFESREAMYRFEFIEDSREDLQDVKSRFLKWLANVQNAVIQDDDIPGRHLIGSFSEAEFEEGEEGESGSLEVTFLCQPFFEADEETVKTLSAGSNTVTIEGQAVNAYAKSSGTSTLQIGGVNQSVGTTEIRLSQQLKPGDNAVTVTGSAVTLRWRELTI